jgi:hypothetical protein
MLPEIDCEQEYGKEDRDIVELASGWFPSENCGRFSWYRWDFSPIRRQ